VILAIDLGKTSCRIAIVNNHGPEASADAVIEPLTGPVVLARSTGLTAHGST
jgi:sugar (pentulose or hexulose) kinase